MGEAKGNPITEKQIESLFALKHCVRTVDKHGQVRLHNHIFYVDEGLRKEKVKISIYSDCLQVEFDGQVIVEYPCHYDIEKKKITRIDQAAIWWTASKSKQIAFFSYELYRIVFVVTTVQRRRLKQGIDATQMVIKFPN